MSESSEGKTSTPDTSHTEDGEQAEAKAGMPSDSEVANANGDEAPAARAAKDSSGESESLGSDGSQNDSDNEKSDKGLMLWVLGVAAVLSIELFIYGHNGEVEVCVGIDGVTDFALAGKSRTSENYRKFPQCAKRLNLGMWSSSEDQAVAALDDACGRATAMVAKTEKRACIRRDNGWKRAVTKTHIPPWDRRLYRRLLWLD